MKTLEEVKDEYAKDMACSNSAELLDKLTWSGAFEEMEEFHDEVAKRFAIEVARESLKNASENVEVHTCRKYNKSRIDTDSILNENNIPKI